MIRRLLAHPLDWRFRAVVERLDSLAARAQLVDARLDGLEKRLTGLAVSLDGLGAQTPSDPDAAAAPASGAHARGEEVSPDLERLSSRPGRFVGHFHGAEYDTPIDSCSPRSLTSYVICSTPRSGSGLLCRGLATLGKLGVPEEYFNQSTRELLSERWGCGSDLRAYVETLHARRSTPAGLFATKVHWEQLSFLRAESGSGPHDHYVHETPDALIDRLFPAPRFIRIVRDDLDSQAVSYWRALNSTVWSVDAGEPADADTPAPYSYEGIDRCRRLIEGGELCWDRLLRARGEDPLVITYEELARDYAETLARVADYLEPGLEIAIAPPRTQRQRDSRSHELLERFRAERPLRPSDAVNGNARDL